MADDRHDGHTHETFGQTLGALGPGGTASLEFDEYTRLFGKEPTEDEIEGERAGGKFAAKHGCEAKVDHAKQRVWFSKRG